MLEIDSDKVRVGVADVQFHAHKHIHARPTRNHPFVVELRSERGRRR